MHWAYCDTSDFSQDALDTAYRALSPSRKDHIDRLKKSEDRRRSLCAELLVQRLLQKYYSLSHCVLHRRENGAPYLTGCDLFVSISHCDEKIACAVSETPVGIDIEKVRPVDLKLCRHVCLPEETEYVLREHPEFADQHCSNPDVLKRFFEIWTAKEAYFKKQGTGITDLKSVCILPLPRQLHQTADYIIQWMV